MNKNFRNFLISLYKPVKGLTAIMLGSMIISQILEILKQYVIKGIIDLPTMNGFKIGDLYSVIATLLVIIVLELIFFYISNITRTIHVLKKQTPYIAQKLFNNLDKKIYPFFVDNFSGKISTSINEISDEVVNLNEKITTRFISILTSMITSLTILYTIDLKIFFTAAILFGGIIVTRIVYFSKKYLPFIKKSQEYNREYNGILNDAVLNFTSLKIYSAVETFSKTLKLKKQESNYYKNKASTKEFSYGAVANVVYVIVFAILMIYSIKSFESGVMSLGNLVFVINAMLTLKTQTTSFAWAYINIGESIVKMKKSYELLYVDNNVVDDNKEDITVETGKIQFKDMSFKYNKNYVFENFNLLINDKQKIGIIGVSGSGKTTLGKELSKKINFLHKKNNLTVELTINIC